MILLALYYGLLLGGLAAMLFDGLGGLAFITYFVVMPVGALAMWHRQDRHFSDLGWGYYPSLARHLLLGTGSAAILVVAILGIISLAGWLTLPAPSPNAFGLLLGVIVQQALVALLEELTFRGVIQQLLTAQLGFMNGLGTTAILFGFFHLPNILYHDVPLALIPLTVGSLALMGGVFGWAFARTHYRLALPVALHFGWNVACFGLDAVFPMAFSGPRRITGVTAWFPESGLLGTTGLLVLALLISRFTPPVECGRERAK